MTARRLQKWHGAGNDFLVDVVGPGEGRWWDASRARNVLARATGVGADGLLIAELSEPVAMTLYNADGSVAEMSGNGIRCLAAAVARSTGAATNPLEVETAAGPRAVELVLDDARLTGSGSVTMGVPVLSVGPPGTMGAASVGNPHVVVLDSDDWDDATRERLAAEWSEEVGGANVEFVRVVSPTRLDMRVIERGVGWTRACGTGSVASAAVAHAQGLVGESVVVENPGGPLLVGLDGPEAVLSGPVQFVADVEWSA